MKARNPSTGNLEEVYVKALDSLPVGTEVDFTGSASDIPAGWEQSSGSQDLPRATDIDNLTDAGNYSIFRATGTLPAGYSQDDYTFLLDVKSSSNGKVQTLYDVNSNKVYIRRMTQYGTQYSWASWTPITKIHSTDEQVVGTWIDGKPIYRKVLTKNITSSTLADVGAINNVDYINLIESNTVFTSGNITYYVPFSNYETSSNFTKFFIQKNSSNKATITWTGNSTTGTLYAVVEYTKTTD